GLITQRSQVQILPPLLSRGPGHRSTVIRASVVHGGGIRHPRIGEVPLGTPGRRRGHRPEGQDRRRTSPTAGSASRGHLPIYHGRYAPHGERRGHAGKRIGDEIGRAHV